MESWRRWRSGAASSVAGREEDGFVCRKDWKEWERFIVAFNDEAGEAVVEIEGCFVWC